MNIYRLIINCSILILLSNCTYNSYSNLPNQKTNRINEQDTEAFIYQNETYTIDKTKKEYILKCLENNDINLKVDPSHGIFGNQKGNRKITSIPPLNYIIEYNEPGETTFLQCFDRKGEVVLAKELESDSKNSVYKRKLLLTSMNYLAQPDSTVSCMQCGAFKFKIDIDIIPERNNKKL